MRSRRSGAKLNIRSPCLPRESGAQGTKGALQLLDPRFRGESVGLESPLRIIRLFARIGKHGQLFPTFRSGPVPGEASVILRAAAAAAFLRFTSLMYFSASSSDDHPPKLMSSTLVQALSAIIVAVALRRP